MPAGTASPPSKANAWIVGYEGNPLRVQGDSEWFFRRTSTMPVPIALDPEDVVVRPSAALHGTTGTFVVVVVATGVATVALGCR